MDEPDNRLPRNEANKIILKYGIIAVVFYIVYFMIMKLAGLIPHTEFRFLNYLIYGIVGFFALKSAKQSVHGEMSYLQGLGIGFMTGAFSFILFGLFIFIFAHIDADFMNIVLKQTSESFDYTPLSAGFLVGSEGITFSIIISLCLMQYFKN